MEKQCKINHYLAYKEKFLHLILKKVIGLIPILRYTEQYLTTRTKLRLRKVANM